MPNFSERLVATIRDVIDFDRSVRDGAEARLLAMRDSDEVTSADRVNIDFALATAAQRRGAHKEALDRLNKINAVAGSHAAAGKLQLRATSLYQLGRYSQAATAFDKLLARLPDDMDAKTIAFWRIEAGRAFAMARRLGDAIVQTRLAVDALEAIGGEAEHLVRARSNMAAFMLRSPDQAQRTQGETDLELLTDAKIASGDVEGMANNFSTLSLHFWQTGRLEKAIAYGRKDLMLARRLGDERGLAASLGNIAAIYLDARQLSVARARNDEMRRLGEALSNPEVMSKADALAQAIEAQGRKLGQQGIGIGPLSSCACGSGKAFSNCCGLADHEPVALRPPVGGVSEDVADITEKLAAKGLTLTNLDLAMRNSDESRRRVSWSEMKIKDGWFELLELPDMANLHFNAAKALAAAAHSDSQSLDAPLACAMLAVSALEAFINSTIFFAVEATAERSLGLPAEMLEDPIVYQRQTNLLVKWDAVGASLCHGHWPLDQKLWENFSALVELRNELVHFKAEGFEKVAPIAKAPRRLKRVAGKFTLREGPLSWPVKLLTPSFAQWSVSIAQGMMHHFREAYAAAHEESTVE